MKKIYIGVITIAFAIISIIGAPYAAQAATSPSLGSASAFSIFSSTFTNSNTSPQTAITGDICFTTPPATFPISIIGATVTPCSATNGIDQGSALSDLNSQLCTSLGAAVTLSGTYTPGCYSSTGAMDIVASTTVTLSGSGVFIFRPGGALTTGANSIVTLAGGACASDVYWTPGAATTLGANASLSATPTFIGNIIDAAGISFGHFAHLSGRALAFGGTVTTDANTITVPTCASSATLRVIKSVVGGTAVPSDFNMHVKLAGVDVTGSPAVGTSTPGTAYSLSAGTYVVSEDANTSYARSFSSACSASGTVALVSGDIKTCTITNTFISAPTSTTATLRVIKLVVGGTALPSSFSIYVKNASSSNVSGSPTIGTSAPGTSYSLSAGTYVVSEDTNSLYARSFTGGCNSNGIITLVSSTSNVCTIVNTVIPPVPMVSVGNNNVGTFATTTFVSVATTTVTTVPTSTIATVATTTSVAFVVTPSAPESNKILLSLAPGFPDTGFSEGDPQNIVMLFSLFIASFLYLAIQKKKILS